MELAPLAPGDRGALAALVAATGVFREAEVAVAVELFDEAFAPGGGGGTDDTGYAFVGAFEGTGAARRLTGYACWGRTPGTRGTFDLYWLAVDPARQGTGIGAALVREVEGRVAASGGRLLVIEASGRPEHAGVRRFYERAGSRAAATVTDFYAPDDDRVIYTMRVGATRAGGTTRGSDGA
ncbi:MAG: GNAT family N-acetyltransferase [Gemmatimonadetes bacterium]|nr:GNAT family N-acetyltransferase [Gemmatimonadota bacterium]